jgi:hypothetical protein
VRHRLPLLFSLCAVAFASALVLVGDRGVDDVRKPLTEPSGTLFVQLLRPGEPIAVIDLPAGKPTIVRRLRLAAGDAHFRLHRTGRRLVYRGVRGTYAIDLDLTGRPQKLGEAWYFIPSATEGHVWLTWLDRHSPETVRDLRSVTEVTVRSRVTVRPGRRPPCRGPTVLAAVEGALLCQAGARRLDAFDPRTGRIIRRLPGPFPLDTHASLVAWCAERCPTLHLTDIATGANTAVAPSDHFRFEESYEGAFSPGGSLLATPVVIRGRHASPTSIRRKVALIDVARGTARLITDSRLSDYGNMAWSSSGEWLFLDAGGGRIMAHHARSGRTTLLPFILGSQLLDLAAS